MVVQRPHQGQHVGVSHLEDGLAHTTHHTMPHTTPHTAHHINASCNSPTAWFGISTSHTPVQAVHTLPNDCCCTTVINPCRVYRCYPPSTLLLGILGKVLLLIVLHTCTVATYCCTGAAVATVHTLTLPSSLPERSLSAHWAKHRTGPVWSDNVRSVVHDCGSHTCDGIGSERLVMRADRAFGTIIFPGKPIPPGAAHIRHYVRDT